MPRCSTFLRSIACSTLLAGAAALPARADEYHASVTWVRDANPLHVHLKAADGEWALWTNGMRDPAVILLPGDTFTYAFHQRLGEPHWIANLKIVNQERKDEAAEFLYVWDGQDPVRKSLTLVGTDPDAYARLHASLRRDQVRIRVLTGRATLEGLPAPGAAAPGAKPETRAAAEAKAAPAPAPAPDPESEAEGDSNLLPSSSAKPAEPDAGPDPS